MTRLVHLGGVAMVNPRYVSHIGHETRHGENRVYVTMASDAVFIVFDNPNETYEIGQAQWEFTCRQLGVQL